MYDRVIIKCCDSESIYNGSEFICCRCGSRLRTMKESNTTSYKNMEILKKALTKMDEVLEIFKS